jgi:hypothetical protein
MPSQVKGNARARTLCVIDMVGTAALLATIFIVPVYTTGGASNSSQTGVTTESTGSATLIASNPQAFTVLTVIVALAIAALVLSVLVAWLGSSRARTGLAVVLVPLTALAVLGMLSVGVFMAPLVVLGWCVFAFGGKSSDGVAP